MATFYVANSGSDANNGTAPTSPWQTIAKVNSTTLHAGDVVLFNRGDIWREQLTNSAASVTYSAYGTGNKPSIRGSNTFNVAGNWTNKSGNLWYVSAISADPGVFVHDGTLGIRKTSEGALGTQWDYWYDAPNSRLEIFSVGNPTGLATLLEVAVRAQWWNQFGSDGINISNLDLQQYSATIWLAFNNITVNYITCDFSKTAKYCIQYNNGGKGSVSGCTFTDWGVVDGQQYGVHCIGFGAVPSGPVDVTGCTFTINHSQNVTELGCVVGDQLGWIRNCTGNVGINNGNFPGSMFWCWRASAAALTINFSNNACYRPGSQGVYVQEPQFGGASPTITMAYNYIEDACQGNISDTSAMKIFVTTTAPCTIMYNVINRTKSGGNTHPGIYVEQAVGAKVYNNTIVGCDAGIQLQTASTGTDIRDNVSAFNRTYGIDVIDTSTATTFNHNLFNTNATANYHGIAAGTGDLTTDPKFVNRASNNLTVQGTSPATGSGTALAASASLGIDNRTPGPVFQFVTQPALWSMGAFIAIQGSALFTENLVEAVNLVSARNLLLVTNNLL